MNNNEQKYTQLNYGDIVRSLDNEELSEFFFSLLHSKYPLLTAESLHELFNSNPK